MDTNKHELFLKKEVFDVVGCAIEVLNELGHGLLEKPDENALVVELEFRSHPKTSFGLKMALFASGRRQSKAALALAKADLTSLPETNIAHFQSQSRFWDDF